MNNKNLSNKRVSQYDIETILGKTMKEIIQIAVNPGISEHLIDQIKWIANYSSDRIINEAARIKRILRNLGHP